MNESIATQAVQTDAVPSEPVPPSTTVCIAGCGPAGAVLGLMLARAGIEVVVLEKHADFLRDFRGDTIHASTLQVLTELDLLAGFERLPHQRVTSVDVLSDDGMLTLGDFRRLPGNFQHMAMVPQWEFLTFLTGEAMKNPSFTLCRRTEAVDLVVEDGVVCGVRYRTPDGAGELRAALVVAADGRNSAVRAAAGLAVTELGSALDVLWYRLPKGPGDPEGSFARLAPGRLLPMIDRGGYWQGAYTMTKGTYGAVRAAGIEAMRADLGRWLPFPAERIASALRDWADTGFLEVRVNRLPRWHRPGLLCIGDAAHAMSPVAGVGINLAIQDAVAAANLLSGPLVTGTLTERDLARVQRRRSLPARLTQRVQLLVQRQMISAADDPDRRTGFPRPMRVLAAVPPVQRVFSRFMAIGIRNEHVAGYRAGPRPALRSARAAGRR